MPPHQRVEEAALQSAAVLGADCCGATFFASLPSLAALGAAAPALDCSRCSEPASWCREDGAGGPKGTNRTQDRDGTQRAQWTWREVESSGGDAAPQLVLAQLGKGVQGAILLDHCPLLHLERDFQGGTSPDAVPQGCDGETAIGLRAEKAVLSTVGFYTNKKYNRQAGLCAISSTALMRRVQALCSSGGSGLCWCDWWGGSSCCRPQLPGDLALSLSILTDWALVLLLWGGGC